MSTFTDNLQRFVKKITLYGEEYGRIFLHWNLKCLKTQRHRFQQCFAERKLREVMSAFGREAYLALKEGKADWQDAPSVKEQLEALRLAEANVEHFRRLRDTIERQFSDKKEEIRQKVRENQSREGT